MPVLQQPRVTGVPSLASECHHGHTAKARGTSVPVNGRAARTLCQTSPTVREFGKGACPEARGQVFSTGLDPHELHLPLAAHGGPQTPIHKPQLCEFVHLLCASAPSAAASAPERKHQNGKQTEVVPSRWMLLESPTTTRGCSGEEVFPGPEVSCPLLFSSCWV